MNKISNPQSESLKEFYLYLTSGKEKIGVCFRIKKDVSWRNIDRGFMVLLDEISTKIKEKGLENKKWNIVIREDEDIGI